MEVLKNFLRPVLEISNVYGNGKGEGYGNGNGYGYGDGDGNGEGYGNGNGEGEGNGNGYGYENVIVGGIKSFNKKQVHIIDSIQTILTKIKGDIATGYILGDDLQLKTCYIVRNDYFFSHGDTLKEALKSLEDKTYLNLPIENRIKSFISEFPSLTEKYLNQDLYDWHFKLTGSCKTGRDSFCKNHEIDLKNKMTVIEFITFTENSYQGYIIKQLKNSYK